MSGDAGARAEVIVVGAGIVGASIAYRVARSGARVTLLDAGVPGRGTSATSFAWVNANDKAPEAYHRLNAAGMGAHRRLRDDLLAESVPSEAGGDQTTPISWLHDSGGLELAGEEEGDALLERAARLQRWGYRVEVIDVAAAGALEPHLRLDGLVAATFCADEAWVDVPAAVAAAVAGVSRHGGTVRSRAPVSGFLKEGDRIAGVTLAAPRVVLAAGRWTDGLARLAGVDVPLAPTSGLLAVTAPIGGGVSRVVHVPGMNFRPDPGGGYVLQSGATDATVTEETPADPPPPGCDVLLERVARFLPALAGARIAAARVGTRPMPADGFTLAGAVDERPGLFLAVTHSGVTLGPLLGELLASEVGSAAPSPLLEHFRPGRLVRPLPAGAAARPATVPQGTAG